MTSTETTSKKILFSMGGKGGVGKTVVMSGIAEYLNHQRVPVQMIDCDTENKSKGSLSYFYNGRIQKVDIRKPTGLDAFVELAVDNNAPVVLADLGAGSGVDVYAWFDAMYDELREFNLQFVAVGVITANPASIETLFEWASRLKKRVKYLVARNLKDGDRIDYFDKSEEGKKFREAFKPAVITLEARLAEIQAEMENHGATMTRVLEKTDTLGPLSKTAAILRVRGYRSRLFAELDAVRDLLVPSAER